MHAFRDYAFFREVVFSLILSILCQDNNRIEFIIVLFHSMFLNSCIFLSLGIDLKEGFASPEHVLSPPHVPRACPKSLGGVIIVSLSFVLVIVFMCIVLRQNVFSSTYTSYLILVNLYIVTRGVIHPLFEASSFHIFYSSGDGVWSSWNLHQVVYKVINIVWNMIFLLQNCLAFNTSIDFRTYVNRNYLNWEFSIN